ncbi:MAG: hypothetical protein BWY31_04357 [Lentisphaerae bacterium ADurb.Bin242]|nr:MAG: hypothetical protein BWY31_04357 [Lentisphaerae bacterium ADurb.Bin242]
MLRHPLEEPLDVFRAAVVGFRLPVFDAERLHDGVLVDFRVRDVRRKDDRIGKSHFQVVLAVVGQKDIRSPAIKHSAPESVPDHRIRNRIRSHFPVDHVFALDVHDHADPRTDGLPVPLGVLRADEEVAFLRIGHPRLVRTDRLRIALVVVPDILVVIVFSLPVEEKEAPGQLSDLIPDLIQSRNVRPRLLRHVFLDKQPIVVFDLGRGKIVAHGHDLRPEGVVSIAHMLPPVIFQKKIRTRILDLARGGIPQSGPRVFSGDAVAPMPQIVEMERALPLFPSMAETREVAPVFTHDLQNRLPVADSFRMILFALLHQTHEQHFLVTERPFLCRMLHGRLPQVFQCCRQHRFPDRRDFDSSRSAKHRHSGVGCCRRHRGFMKNGLFNRCCPQHHGGLRRGRSRNRMETVPFFLQQAFNKIRCRTHDHAPVLRLLKIS